MTKLDLILCFFGFHVWDNWITMYSKVDDDGKSRPIFNQHMCKRCRIIKTRKIDK